MRPRIRRDAWLAALFAGVFLLGLLTPAVMSGKLNPLFHVPSPSSLYPGTGNEQVDQAMGTALGALDAAAQQVNGALAPLRSEPQVPATLYHDSLEPGRRIGGWGDWRQPSPGGDHWALAGEAATEGTLGYSFSDPSTGYYPVVLGGPTQTLNSYLVSPRISLQSLPVDVSAGKPVTSGTVEAANATCMVGTIGCLPPAQTLVNGVNVQGYPQPSDPTHITLGIDHRFNFAAPGLLHLDNTRSTGGTGRDGGRVELFTHAPTRQDLANGGAVLTPLFTNQYNATSFGNDPRPAFTGLQRDFVRESFDLTNYAGSDVWLVFHTASAGVSDRNAFFTNGVYFNAGVPFYGWQFDNVTLEGPAYLHNLRLDQLLQPVFGDPATGAYTLPPGGDQDPMGILVMNHGQVTERNVQVTLALDGSTQACAPDPRNPVPLTLVPGEVEPLRFRCPVAEGSDHSAVFNVAPDPADPTLKDLFPSDNQRTLQLHVTRGTSVHVDSLAVDPRLGSEDDVRTLTAVVANTGYGSEKVQLGLKVQKQDVGPDGQLAGTFSNVTLPQGFASQLPAQAVPPDPDGKLNHATFTWAIRLPGAGVYLLRVTGSTVGETHVPIEQAVASASALISNNVLYSDGFATATPDRPDIVVGNRQDWQPEDLKDTQPPCVPACTTAWELPSALTPAQMEVYNALFGLHLFPGHATAVLRGQVDQATQAQLATSPDQFTDLQVRVVHSIDNLACLKDGWGADCRGKSGSDHELSIRLAQTDAGAPVAFNLIDQTTVVKPIVDPVTPSRDLIQLGNIGQAVLFEANHFSSNGLKSEPTNRYGYLNGQWMDETFSVSIRAPGSRVDQATGVPVPSAFTLAVPAQSLANLALDFTENDVTCPATQEQLLCPTWRVSYAEVVGITASGPKLLLQTGGAADLGNWMSYYQGTGDQNAVSSDSSTAYSSPGSYTSCLELMAALNAPQNTGGDTQAAGDDAASLQDRQGDLFRCPFWHAVPTAGLVAPPSAWHWHPRLGTIDQQEGIWTNDDDATTALRYGDSQQDLLVSPTFKLPPNAPEPTLQFDHKFSFQAMTSPSNPPSQQDSGMLMVRRMRLDTATGQPVPDSPFLPVAVRGALASALPQRYQQTDCDVYGTLHPDGADGVAACKALPLATRQMVRAQFDLLNLSVLDYRGLQPGPDGGLTGDLADPDPAALHSWNLKADCGGPCLFQLAFRVQTIDGRQLADGAAARAAGHAIPQGWFIDKVSILGEKRKSHDVQVTDATLNATYDWKSLGLGPASQATFHLQVSNLGLFKETAESLRLRVQVKDLLDDNPLTQIHTYEPALPSDFAIAPGSTATVDAPFLLPGDATSTAVVPYRIQASLEVHQELGGLLIKDEAPDDNCAAVDPSGRFVPSQCLIDNAPVLVVQGRPSLGVGLAITPEAGRSDFKRQVHIEVRNEGNVPVAGEQLRLVAKGAGTATVLSYRYTLQGAIGPGATQPITRLDAQPEPGSDQFDQGILLGRPDRYIVTASLPQFGAVDQVLADSFTTFYADKFTGKDFSNDPTVAKGPLAPSADGAWTLSPAVGAPGSPGAWVFGDLARGRVPDNANATLDLPPLDLSAVSRASLAFTHRYALEPGQDGGRVEWSLDNGTTWAPLVPKGGYPGQLVSRTAFNPGGDPTVGVPAFTGDSRDAFPLTDGWGISEFNLGQIPGLTTPVQVQRLAQDGFRDQPVQLDAPKPGILQDTPVGSILQDTSWRAGTAGCGTACWYVQDLTYRTPAPNPGGLAPEAGGDGAFWWSGTLGATPKPGPQAMAAAPLGLDLVLPKRGQSDGQLLPFLSFWAWKDAGGKLTLQAVQGGTVTSALAQTPVESRPDGWVRYVVDLSAQQKPDQASPVRVVFSFGDNYADAPDRGVALDGVQVQLAHVTPAGLQDKVTLGDAIAESAPAWTNGVKQDCTLGQEGACSLKLDALDVAGATVSQALAVPLDAAKPVSFWFQGDRVAGGTDASVAFALGAGTQVTVQLTGSGTSGHNGITLSNGGPASNVASWATPNAWYQAILTFDPGAAHTATIQVKDAAGNVVGSSVSVGIGSATTLTGVSFYATYAANVHDTFHFDALNLGNGAGEGWENGLAGWSVQAGRAPLGWSAVARIPSAPNAWNLQVGPGHGDASHPVWTFGDPVSPASQQLLYPGDAVQRLATPVFSLKQVGGSTATLTYWQATSIPANDKVEVYVQAYEPQAEGADLPGPWHLLPGGGPCLTSGQWCQQRIDVHDFVGKDVRFAFQASTSRLDPTVGVPQAGFFWSVDEVGIDADAFAGRQLRLRLHAATDTSLGEGAWMVDDLQVVGVIYKVDVAIVPDAAPPTRLAPGSTLTVSGKVRNLGASSTPLLQLALDPHGKGTVEQTLGPTGSFALSSPRDGHGGDSLPYSFTIHFPDASGTVPVDLHLLGAPRDDQNLGDHERSFSVQLVKDPSIVPGNGAVDLPAPQVGQTVNFTADVENTGTIDGTASVQFVVADVPGAVTGLQATAVPAGQTVHASGQWIAAGPGLHKVTAILTRQFGGAPTTQPFDIGYVYVGSKPIFFHDSFEARGDGTDPFGRGWSTAAFASRAACAPGSPNTNTNGGPLGSWLLDTGVGFDDGRSMRIGADGAGASAGQHYDAYLDQALLSPSVDLGALGGLAPGSPLSPVLSFETRALVGDNAGLLVQATRQGPGGDNGNFYAIQGVPGQSENGVAICDNPLRNSAVVKPTLLFDTDKRPIITGNDDHWRTAAYAIGTAILPQPSGPNVPLLGHPIQFAFRFGSAQGNGASFAIDTVTVSAYSLAVEPAEHDIVLRNGANKTYEFVVRNTGAAQDTYHVEPRVLGLPAKVHVSVFPTDLPLAPGASGRVAVTLQVGDDDRVTFKSGSVQLRINSTAIPSRAATASVKVTEFQTTLLPDLAITLDRSFGESGPLSVGDAASFLATVKNIGHAASRPTSLLAVACPVAAGSTDLQTVSACRGALQRGQAGPVLVTPAPVAVPALCHEGAADCDPTFSSTIAWTVPRGVATGNYLLLAIVDPPEAKQDLNRELRLDNNLAKRLLSISAEAKPDLAVTALEVDTGDGLVEAGPGHAVAAFEGQALTVRATFTNIGPADAHSVQLALNIQFPLVEKSLALLAKGDSMTLETQWVAQPGTWVLAAQATTPDTELRADNDALRMPLLVRRGTVDAAFDPAVADVRPGGALDLALTLRNLRANPLAFQLVADAPEELHLAGLPGNLTLPRGGEQALALRLEASPFLTPGTASVLVHLVPPGGGPDIATATLSVQSAGRADLSASTVPLFTPPGQAVLPLTVRNGGSVETQAHVTLVTPAEWGALLAPSRVQLAPGQEKALAATLTIPPRTPAGAYTVEVWAGASRLANATIHVTSSPAWTSDQLGARSEGATDLTLLRITNSGNAPATPPASLFPDGATVTPRPGTLAPGESVDVQVRVPHTVSTPTVAGSSPDGGAAVPDWQPPASKARAGQPLSLGIVLRNPSPDAQADVPVREFVDGLLVAEQRVDLPAGAARTVNFTWAAQPGTHVLSLSYGNGTAGALRSTVVDVSGAAQGAPGAGLVAALVALGAAALQRRRRDA